VRIITEFELHTDGITYSLQGYATLEGEVPSRIIDEYRLCKRIYERAAKEKREIEKRKANARRRRR
jgi:hypothetical protein